MVETYDRHIDLGCLFRCNAEETATTAALATAT
jgi:hypothetical protein